MNENCEKLIEAMVDLVFEQAKGYTFKNDFRADFRNEIRETVEKYDGIVSFILSHNSRKAGNE